MFSAERNPAILLFVRTRAKSRAMAAPLHAPGVQRIGRRATGARRTARRRCARLCSRQLDAVGAGSTDASSVVTLRTRPDKPVAGRLGAAIARKISRKPLKTLIPRPGLRPPRPAIGAIGAVRAGSPVTSSPATLGTRPEETVASRPAVAVARKISCNPLKTLIPRPGSPRLRPAVGAIRAVRAGSPDTSSPATLGTRPDKPVAGRLGAAIARKISPKPVPSLLVLSLSKDAPARTNGPAHWIILRQAQDEVVLSPPGLGVAVARNICRKTLKTLIQRPGRLPRRDLGSSPGMSKDASARTERPHPLIIFQHPGLTLLHSHISNRSADPLLQLCWGRWREAPDGVRPTASNQVGLRGCRREPSPDHTCFPHPIRPSGPPSPPSWRRRRPTRSTCVNAAGPDPGIRMRFRLWRLGRRAENRKWRRISLKTLETELEMAGPTALTRPGSTRSARCPG